MDFSWVKELADQANLVEQQRKEHQHHQMEVEKQLSLATAPFIDKLHMVISACAEEFNKYIQSDGGKVTATRIQKRVKRWALEKDPDLTYAEESTFFTFSRKDWVFGIRGCGGIVEFIELATTGEPMSVRMDEVCTSPVRKLEAYLDPGTQQVGWQENGQVVDGAAIMTVCREFFRQFIERTN